MKRYKPLFALVLLSLPSFGLADEVQKKTLALQDRAYTYYLFVPDSAQARPPAPLLILLHGSQRNGRSLVERWMDIAKQEGIILVGPDAINSASWSIPDDGPDRLRSLVGAVSANHAVNPRKVFLFGHSAGAFFALTISLLESQYFAATAIHAGGLPDKSAVLLDRAKRKIPIAIFSGVQDKTVPIALVRASRDELAKRGFPVVLNEIPNHDHWYYDLAPKINRSAWEFLKNQKLEENPQYERYRFNK